MICVCSEWNTCEAPPPTSERPLGCGSYPLGAVTLAPAAPAAADPAPAGAAGAPSTVSADALPTAQINGIVWDQVVVGDIVYAVGKFSAVRPAGSPAGQNESPRSNAMAYNINTGADRRLAPTTNGTINAIAASGRRADPLPGRTISPR